MRKTKGLRQAYDLQDATYASGVILRDAIAETSDDDIRARLSTALAGLVRSWDAATERVRILRGRPLPGSLRPEQPARKPRRAAGPAWQAPEPAQAAPTSAPTSQAERQTPASDSTAQAPAAPSAASQASAPIDASVSQEPGAPGPA